MDDDSVDEQKEEMETNNSDEDQYYEENKLKKIKLDESLSSLGVSPVKLHSIATVKLPVGQEMEAGQKVL